MSHPAPIELLRTWIEDGRGTGRKEPNAVALATATKDGTPTVRMVLVKEFNESGFPFYTNLGSPKARDILENPKAALCWYWDQLNRQVRVVGHCEPVSSEEADRYFASRPRGSQIGAWASLQSTIMDEPMDLAKRVVKYTTKFALGQIPRPDFWSGFRLIPEKMEFWENKTFRLHDRFEFRKKNDEWIRFQLYP